MTTRKGGRHSQLYKKIPTSTPRSHRSPRARLNAKNLGSRRSGNPLEVSNPRLHYKAMSYLRSLVTAPFTPPRRFQAESVPRMRHWVVTFPLDVQINVCGLQAPLLINFNSPHTPSSVLELPVAITRQEYSLTNTMSASALWCYNRTTVFRSAIFKWNKDVQFLALAFFVLTQCDMKHAGFDPNVHRFIPPQPDDPVSASAILPLERPVEEMKNLCFRFSSGMTGVPDWIFWIQKVLYTYRGIVGRGTFVAAVRAAIVGEVMRKGLFAFKQSWQYQVRAHEATMIAKLRERLPEY